MGLESKVTNKQHSSALPPVAPRIQSRPVKVPVSRRYGGWGIPRRVGPSQAHRMQGYRRRGADVELPQELSPRSEGVWVHIQDGVAQLGGYQGQRHSARFEWPKSQSGANFRSAHSISYRVAMQRMWWNHDRALSARTQGSQEALNIQMQARREIDFLKW